MRSVHVHGLVSFDSSPFKSFYGVLRTTKSNQNVVQIICSTERITVQNLWAFRLFIMWFP